MRNSKILCRFWKRFLLGVVFSIALPNCVFGATNITSNVENGGNLSNSNNDTYYVLSGENNYNFWQIPQDITTNHTNGTLIFGNDKKEASSSHTFNFRTWGLYNYTASFTAKDIYLTGNITSSVGTGSNNLTFAATGEEGIEMNGFYLNLANNGTFTGNKIVIDDSSFLLNGGNTNLQITADKTLNIGNTTITLQGKTLSTAASQVTLKGESISLDNTAIQATRTDVNTLSQTLNVESTNGDITFTGSKFEAQKGGSLVNLKATNGSIIFNDSSLTQGDDGTYSSWQTTLSADKDIVFNNSNITIRSGDLSHTADQIKFTAGGNISLQGTTNITTRYGGANVNFQAGQNLDIKELNLTYVMPAGFSNVYGSFVGENITISSGSIRQDLTASLAVMNLTFGDSTTNSINLGDTYLHLMAGTAAYGGSTATFNGQTLAHKGSIVLGRDGESVDDQFLDSGLTGAELRLSGITGKAEIGSVSSRKGRIYANSDLSVDSLRIRASAAGVSGDNNIRPETDFYAKDYGNYAFGDISLQDLNATATALLYFHNGFGANLKIDNLTLGASSGLYASSVSNSIVTNILLRANSEAEFHHLTLTPGGQIVMDVTSTLEMKNQLVNGVNEAAVLELGVSVKDSGLVNGYGKPVIAFVNAGNQLENINVNESGFVRLVDSGEIRYNFIDTSGNTTTFNCGGNDERCEYIKTLLALYGGEKVEGKEVILEDGSKVIDYTDSRIDLSGLGLKYEKVLSYSYIGLQLTSDNTANPYDIGDIRYYLWQKCGDECVAQVGGISSISYTQDVQQKRITGLGEEEYLYTDSKGEVSGCKEGDSACISGKNAKMVEHVESDIFDWLNFLSIHQRGITWTGANVLNYSLDFFMQTATQLNNTLGQLASIERKSSAASSTRLAADIARIQRLVKLSNAAPSDDSTRFARLVARAKHYANNQAIQSDVPQGEQEKLDPAFLYKFSNRHSFANNIWTTAIGSASFVPNGYGTLYGINVGYDRFIPIGNSGMVLGAFGAYGYGSYNADLLKNQSHNINAGMYSRSFIKNHEIDVNIGYTLGINNEGIYTRQNVWLSALDQSYGYNTHTINVNANYGYVFGLKEKTIVFKPMGGFSYYRIGVDELNGANKNIFANTESTFTPDTTNIAIQSPRVTRHLLALNLSLETRQYFSAGSYWFINVGAQKDLFISSDDVTQVRFVGNNSLSYKEGDMLNTHLLGTAGGEVSLGKQTFVNFAVGSRVGLSYKDLNVTANLGARYVF